MRRRKGMQRIGGWPFWIGFWSYALWRNVRRSLSDHREAA